MVSELVARIREILARPYEPPTASYRALSEAADRIESLSRQLEEAREALREISEMETGWANATVRRMAERARRAKETVSHG